MDFLVPCSGVHMVTGSSFEERPLSKTEKEIRKVLSKTSRKTIFGQCIHIALGEKTDKALRGIISQLKDQLRDAPVELQKAISEEGIRLLKQL